MKKIKTIVDREPLGSDYIASHQNFDQVIQRASQLSTPTWKSAWFYGPIGMAVIAVTVSVVTIDPARVETNDVTANLESPVSNSVILADNSNDDQKPVESFEEPALEQTTSQPTVIHESVHETEVVPQNVAVATRVEVPVEEKAPVTNNKGTFVHIGQYYLGEIPVNALDQPLECNDEIRIIAFNVHFNTINGTETASIIGNKIPAKIIEAIKAHNIGYMITFTDIKGKNAEGKVISLLPMNFIATNLK